ncbi:MAG: ABC transporter permease [Thalassobaculales bacterium]
MSGGLSLGRLYALLAKEFVQAFRDRLTFAMMVGVPIMQLVIFGFAINSDPKNLPTYVMSADDSPMARSVVAALQVSGYFRVLAAPASAEAATAGMDAGRVQFIVWLPEEFGRRVARGERPSVLVEADASDPVATGNALAALPEIARRALARDLAGPLAPLAAGPAPFEMLVHRRYNPEIITAYNVVPGLIGTILTMTMVMMTSIAMTRERERGTYETLLSTPARPIEVMLGKITPYVVIGYIQVGVILVASRLLFAVPMEGSLALLSLALVLFIAANLAIGFTFSTLARTQMQALQMSIFFFLPSMLLSGFMFPFRGMPGWAQAIGECLPLTHVLRIVRGIMLKGNGLAEVAPSLWPLAVILVLVTSLAMLRYRRTLD